MGILRGRMAWIRGWLVVTFFIHMCMEQTFANDCPDGYAGSQCEVDLIDHDVQESDQLGMRSGYIQDFQLTASSQYSNARQPKYCRLNNDRFWRPSDSDSNPWIQVDFLQVAIITKIKTQGKEATFLFPSYVKKYHIKYGYDASSLQYYQINGETKEFGGNFDGGTVRQHAIDPFIVAQVLRVYPIERDVLCVYGLRMELIGYYKGCTDSQALGMEVSLIKDSQLSASTSMSEGLPHYARLHLSGLAWLPANQIDQWLQIDFDQNVAVVTRIATQGQHGTGKWVAKYTLSYSFTQASFVPYKDYVGDDSPKVFNGNTDSTTVVYNSLEPPITAQFVRINPVIVNVRQFALRVELYGRMQAPPCFFSPCQDGSSTCTDDGLLSFFCHCPDGHFGLGCTKQIPDCEQPQALGMENNTILDSQISASTIHGANHEEFRARLNFVGRAGSWVAGPGDVKNWLQVDFLEVLTVTEIQTQGRQDSPSMWSKTFFLTYGYQVPFLREYEENNVVKVFTANTDHSTIVKNALKPIIVARIIRVNVLTYASSYATLRVEYIGCRKACAQTDVLGMSDRVVIPDEQISASSVASPEFPAQNGRLGSADGGVWVALPEDEDPWFQVDFSDIVTVSAITTQGREDVSMWVISYTISFLLEGSSVENAMTYTENDQPKIFDGNTDGQTPVTVNLQEPILAQVVRIHPKDYEQSAAMKVEFTGCNQAPCREGNPCQNGGTCVVQPSYKRGCYCPLGYGGKSCEYNEMDNIRCLTPLGITHDKQTFHVDRITSYGKTVNEHYNSEQVGLLNPDAAWCANPMRTTQILKVFFNTPMTIYGLATQGDPTGNNFVTSYTLKKRVTEGGELSNVAVLQGNADPNSIKQHTFIPPFEAIEVRLVVDEYVGDYPCLRIELYGCPVSSNITDCVLTYGVSRFEGSSENIDNNMTAENAAFGQPNAWCPSEEDTDGRLSFMLDQTDKEVVGIITRGYHGEAHAYVLAYNFDDSNTASTVSQQIEISGNVDGTADTIHFFDSPISLYDDAITLRLRVLESFGFGCLKADLIACDNRIDPCHVKPCGIGGTCRSNHPTVGEHTCDCRSGFSGENCTEGSCYEVLAVHPDDFFPSSDKYNMSTAVDQGYRLAGSATWCADDSDAFPFLVLKLQAVMYISGFGIGGYTDISVESVVRKFNVSTKVLDRQTWTPVMIGEVNVFQGTKKSGSDRVDYLLNSSVLAYTVKFEFMEFSNVEMKCARVEVRGCTVDLCAMMQVCRNNGVCRMEYRKPFVCDCPGGYGGERCEQDLCANCHVDAHCNENSNYTCACNEGFGGNGTYCEDSCLVCHNDSYCNATTGYTCVCNEGFGGDGIFCEDMCLVCHNDSYCNRTTGYMCVCNEGFAGNGTSCEDLCSYCHNDSYCNKTTGYTCVCDEEFGGDGMFCEHFCVTAACHEEAHCSRDTNFTCVCNQDYGGNGTYCEDLCVAQACDPGAHCNRSTNYMCVCDGDSGTRCKVPGNWSTWNAWSPCSSDCGAGYQTRNRTCTNPTPFDGGDFCVGVNIDVDDCVSSIPCPGEEGYEPWSNWTSCNTTCGFGAQVRTRNCSNAELVGCDAKASQEKVCFPSYCPVDGNYTVWGSWSECSKTCGFGAVTRQRNCTNPKPAHGGNECQGPAVDTAECFLELLCLSDLGFTDWSSWSVCSASCGQGTYFRSRHCTIPDPTSFCSGPTNETSGCSLGPCSVDGGLSDWLDWTECDSPCDYGQTERSRTCNAPVPAHGGLKCSGTTRELDDCIITDCEGVHNYSPWSSWSDCSVSCGSGIHSKQRYCQDVTGDGCDGPQYDTKECLQPGCPVHGGFTEWSSWSLCTVTCGSGMIRRERECSNPVPENDGQDCLGLLEEIDYCFMPETCPDEVYFTQWSLWSECNVSCSAGHTTRTRNCTEPSLENCDGEYVQTKPCYDTPCPINGQFAQWQLWSNCSGSCGSGLRTRSRHCDNPTPAYGGADCPEIASELEDCEHPINCSGEDGYSQWSPWSSCTQTCGISVQLRTRTCRDGAPPSTCNTTTTQEKQCNMGKCPVHGGWAEWGLWGSCSVSCGSGVIRRTRSCVDPVPSYGGLPCYGTPEEFSTCAMYNDCPGDAEFSTWGNWGECSVTCGVGQRERSRYCTVVPTYPGPEERPCTLPTKQYLECYPEPCQVHGNFTPWTGWSACSSTCGFGTTTRTRKCTHPPPLFGGEDCLGPLYEVEECQDSDPCSDDDKYSLWSWSSCSSECEGTKYASRECLDDETDCDSQTNISMACNTQPCLVDGVWSTWTEWSTCDKTCGHQEEVRTRRCDNPTPRNGGAGCAGHDIEVMPCSYYDHVPCPEPPPAKWSDWSWWTVCNTTCAGGRQQRRRKCNRPPPALGYPTCEGETDKEQECNTHPCPIHGNFTSWSPWFACSEECGGGQQLRGRLCLNPAPEFGGNKCPDDGYSQLRECNTQLCPIHGGFTEWSEWTFCDRPCNTGHERRERFCTNPTPMHGGRNCTGDYEQSNTCNTIVCSPAYVDVDITFTDVVYDGFDQNDIKDKVDVLIQSTYSSYFPAVSVKSCSPDNGIVRCIVQLHYMSLAQDELVLLQDKLLDNTSNTVLHGMSSDNVLSSPVTVQSSSTSSTSINVSWTALDPSAETEDTLAHTSYIILYKEDNQDRYQAVASAPQSLENNVQKLQKFTSYRIVVCPYSSNGNGVPSSPVHDITWEDVPSMAPVTTSTDSPSPTSIHVSWTDIESQYYHGVPRGYCVFYYASGSEPYTLNASIPSVSSSGIPAPSIRTSGNAMSGVQEIFDISQLNTTLDDLTPYTKYFIQVAARTTPGCGARAQTDIYTLEDFPSEAPQYVVAYNSSSISILVQWNNVATHARNGLIKGFKVSYSRDGVAHTIDVDDGDVRQINITELEIFTEYEIKILAYNNVGDGPSSSPLTVSTDESTPSEAPVFVEAVNTSSTSIKLQWQAISPTSYNGRFLGYRLWYRPAHTTRKAISIDLDVDVFQYELTELLKFWPYEFQVAGFTRVGSGAMASVTVQTDEELPSRFPENIRGIALNPTSMSVEWDPVLPNFLHGILRGYKLVVRETDDLDVLVVDTVLETYERTYYIEGLKKYTNYTIWVQAINTKGLGPSYPPGHVNCTGEDGPEVPPDNIRVSTMAHITKIDVEWTRIPAEFHNGIFRGYHIEYTAIVLAGEVIPTEKRVVQSVRIRGNRYARVLGNLDPGSKYEIVIFGYTSKNGTKSNATIAETCRCPKYIRTNWWVLPPYTNSSNPSQPGGIFFTMAQTCLDDLCGECTNGHGRSLICSSDSCDLKRKRKRRSASYQKNSLQDVSSNIAKGYEMSFPVQGNKYMTTYAGVFPYISVVDAPGSAYFTVKNVPSTAEVVVNTAIGCVPMVILMAMFAYIAGVIIWVLERKENPDHFPDPFTKGAPEGFWWAYISMTTVGYGDRSPTTVPGRLFAIMWVLMGLVIISIVTGGIVTSISSVLVVQETQIYGAKVAAVTNSSEYNKAIRQNADVVGYNNMEEIFTAMKNKEISGALVDMFAAATKKDLLEGGEIELNRMVEYPTGFGVVLSGNMAKAAPLFYQSLRKNKATISNIIEKNTNTISQNKDEAEVAKAMSSGLFDPTAPAFRHSFNVTISLLAVAILIGLIYHYAVFRKREKAEKKKLEKLRETIPEFRVMEYLKTSGQRELEQFTQDLLEQLTKLRKKHIRERKKTSLYQAAKTLHRKTSFSTISVAHKSSARVHPEVNYGMDDVSSPTAGRAPATLSLSSLKRTSGKVCPAES